MRPAGEAPDDKGKGKEVDPAILPNGGASTNHRIPHGLKGFLNDLPGANSQFLNECLGLTFYLGKTSTKKSAPILDLVFAAPKQRMDIVQFDMRTLEHFRLPEGQIVYKNPSALDPESEAKKKRKVDLYYHHW